MKNSFIFAVKAGESTLSRSFGRTFTSLTFARHVGVLYARRCGYVDKKKIKTQSKSIQPMHVFVLHTFARIAFCQIHNSEVPDTNRSKIGVQGAPAKRNAENFPKCQGSISCLNDANDTSDRSFYT